MSTLKVESTAFVFDEGDGELTCFNMYFLWVGENFLHVLEYWSPILLEKMKPINRVSELCLAHNLSIC